MEQKKRPNHPRTVPQMKAKEIILSFTEFFKVVLNDKDSEGNELMILIPKIIEVTLDLHIDIKNNQVWIDMVDAFEKDKGIVQFPGPNCIGNIAKNLGVTIELHRWMAHIMEIGFETFQALNEENVKISEMFDLEAAAISMYNKRKQSQESLDDNK